MVPHTLQSAYHLPSYFHDFTLASWVMPIIKTFKTRQKSCIACAVLASRSFPVAPSKSSVVIAVSLRVRSFAASFLGSENFLRVAPGLSAFSVRECPCSFSL